MNINECFSTFGSLPGMCSILVAFIGGIVTFFASCLLPLVPIYLAYLSGISINTTSPKSKKIFRGEIFEHALIFVLGFIIVFVMFGAAATTLGNFINLSKPVVQKLGGILLIGIGLFMLEIIKPQWLIHELKITHIEKLAKGKKLTSFLTGITFGFAWTPCIGPVLAVILFWASQAETIWFGMGLLLIYGLGLGLPFLIIGMFFNQLAPKLSKSTKFGKWLGIIAGIIIVAAGLLLLLGMTEKFSMQLLNTFNLRTLAY